MSLFRRKHTDESSDDVLSEAEQTHQPGVENNVENNVDKEKKTRATGPGERPIDISEWDGQSRVVDFGSLLIPAVEGMQVRVDVDNEVAVGVSVKLDESLLQLQAFAAPRSEDLWDDVRQEIAEGIRRNQGKARETDGPFGRELRAEVPVASGGSTSRQPVRFLGADGPRWFVRGLISGPGGVDPDKARAVETVFSKLVVRRGDHAAAPRELLPLSIPEDPGLVGEKPTDE